MKPAHTFAIALLQPSGLVGIEERDLMIHATLLMLIVVVPVLVLAFSFAWHYRASNTKAVYAPNWEHAKMDELIWWAIPFEIVLVLGALTWSSTHELDPHRALAMQTPPLKVQVVALEWKWLFIYPEQHIASVNFLDIPVDRPIEFDVTADAPMNSFWIPELGGQIYAMTGMVTTLHLAANKTGSYVGKSANYSGEGFVHMQFSAQASSQGDFDAWVQSVRQSSQTLNLSSYQALAQPSIAESPTAYASVDKTLFNTIVMRFMPASPQTSSRGGTPATSSTMTMPGM